VPAQWPNSGENILHQVQPPANSYCFLLWKSLTTSTLSCITQDCLSGRMHTKESSILIN
jgi:hypothetical protein